MIRPSNPKADSATKASTPLSIILTIGVVYITLSGVLWHLGYWSTFDFNYFEYVDYVDLFKSSFYPFFTSTWILIGIIVMSSGLSYFFIGLEYWRKGRLGYSFQWHDPIKMSNVEKFTADILIALALLFTGIFTIIIRERYSWDVLPFCISAALITIFFRFRLFQKMIPNTPVRILTGFLLFIIPTSNFFNGKKLSLNIKNLEKANIITQFNSADPILNTLVVGKPILGISNDFMFVYTGGPGLSFADHRSNVLVIQRNIIKSYIVSNYVDFGKANISRNDYYDSIKITMKIDSILRIYPKDWKGIDSLYQLHLIPLSSKDKINNKSKKMSSNTRP